MQYFAIIWKHEGKSTLTGSTTAGLSQLIGSIYDRAIDPAAWGETLELLRIALGAENAGIGLLDLRSNQALLSHVSNMPDSLIAELEAAKGRTLELWGGLSAVMSMPMEEPAILSRLHPPTWQGVDSSRDGVAIQGFADAMALSLVRDADVIGSCILGRAKNLGRFREEEISLARMLIPHAQRAIAFSRMFELATLRANAFEAALDAAAVPTFLVTDRSELVYANLAGHAELDQGGALRIAGSRVTVADPSNEKGFRDALETARQRPNAHPRELSVALDAGLRQATLLPLPRNSQRGSLAPSATTAIVLSAPVLPSRRNEEAAAHMLIARHNLTRTEASVALEIAKGNGRAAAAARLGIRENTVRTHLSSVFLKLDINRQAQLVRLIDEQAGTAESAAAACSDA